VTRDSQSRRGVSRDATSARKPSPAAAPDGPGSTLTREFRFSYRDFQRVQKLIYERVGISLSDAKQDMVYSRLSRRLRARGLTTFSDYLDLLVGGDHAEWEAFTNALTTNLTSFFREEHHFPVLAEHAVKRERGQPYNVWCCACSTGEEPYSIAMSLADAFGSLTPPITILATDVDTQVLKTAQEGVYPVERVEKLGPDRMRRYFLRGTGPQAGFARVRPELRSLITFRRMNLLESNWSVRAPFDALFCRNVMIYFDKATQASMLRRFAPLLKPDGLLFMGHSESLFHVADTFRLRGKTVYELMPKSHGSVRE
jgi:chemotaxis protein methyltransferase CheR